MERFWLRIHIAKEYLILNPGVLVISGNDPWLIHDIYVKSSVDLISAYCARCAILYP